MFDIFQGVTPFLGYTKSMRAIDEAGKTCVVTRETESALSHPESISTDQVQQDGVDQLPD